MVQPSSAYTGTTQEIFLLYGETRLQDHKRYVSLIPLTIASCTSLIPSMRQQPKATSYSNQKGNMSLQTKPSTTHHLLVNLVANTNIPNKIGPSPTRLHAIQRATIGHKSQWHEANWMQHMIPTKWTVIVKILLY